MARAPGMVGPLLGVAEVALSMFSTAGITAGTVVRVAACRAHAARVEAARPLPHPPLWPTRATLSGEGLAGQP